jgi:hypothetical protein
MKTLAVDRGVGSLVQSALDENPGRVPGAWSGRKGLRPEFRPRGMRKVRVELALLRLLRSDLLNLSHPLRGDLRIAEGQDRKLLC